MNTATISIQHYQISAYKLWIEYLHRLQHGENEMKGKSVKPFDKREVKDEKKSFSKTEKSVKPVSKDTNKTRRKMVKPTK